ncbi:hypothetical protein MNV49_004002 [Pseudohyphozyma bogoriensis]|nr:hypothetical protein MNV49_004002 [Pseudohyphozyma bogoriensis]
MSRRASYVRKGEDDMSAYVPLQSHRPSVGQANSPNPGQSSSAFTKDFAAEPMNYKESSRYSIPMLDAATRAHLVGVVRQRNVRAWERLVIIILSICLIITMFRGHAETVVERTKMKLAAPKHPLRLKSPLKSFRANLLDSRGYVTSFPHSGLTNQLIEYFKLVHLGQRLDRAVIIPDLKAVRYEGGDVPLSRFFDLQHLSYYSNVSIVEWADTKIPDVPGTEPEKLSCWGWRDDRPLQRYNTHTDFWPPPGQLTVPSSIETAMTFPAMEVLVSQDQTQWLTDKANEFFGGVQNAPAFPDEQVLCFENLFFVPSIHFVQGKVDKTFSLEELSPEDPVWKNAGVHMKFSKHANKIGDELIDSLLGSKSKPFVAVHIRQGDFVTFGRVSSSTDVVEAYAAAEKEVQEEIWRRRKSSVMAMQVGKMKHKRLPVVFATDSEDPLFIKKLTALGWIYINHNDFATVTRFGGWYPGILDSLILSRSVGFVGTKQSTFSYVAARRVESWNGGVSKIV